jgi:hypothetical protein
MLHRGTHIKFCSEQHDTLNILLNIKTECKFAWAFFRYDCFKNYKIMMSHKFIILSFMMLDEVMSITGSVFDLCNDFKK